MQTPSDSERNEIVTDLIKLIQSVLEAMRSVGKLDTFHKFEIADMVKQY